MYSGPIKLPESIQAQINALINLGNVLQLYSISIFVHILDVHQRIVNDRATIIDLQEIVLLCTEIIDNTYITDSLRDELSGFRDVINLFITVASQPSRPCSLWNNTQIEFDEDQYL